MTDGKDKLLALYNTLLDKGASEKELGDYNIFAKNVATDKGKEILYNYLTKKNIPVGNKDFFTKKISEYVPNEAIQEYPAKVSYNATDNTGIPQPPIYPQTIETEQKPQPKQENTETPDDILNKASEWKKKQQAEFEKMPIEGTTTLPTVEVKSARPIEYWYNAAKSGKKSGDKGLDFFLTGLSRMSDADIMNGTILESPEYAKYAPESYVNAVKEHKKEVDERAKFFEGKSAEELETAAEYKNRPVERRTVMPVSNILGAPVQLEREVPNSISQQEEDRRKIEKISKDIGTLVDYMNYLDIDLQKQGEDKDPVKVEKYNAAWNKYHQLLKEVEPYKKRFQELGIDFPYYVPRGDIYLLSKSTGIPISVYETMNNSLIGNAIMHISGVNPDFRNYTPSTQEQIITSILGLLADTPIFAGAGKVAHGITEKGLQQLGKIKYTKGFVNDLNAINKEVIESVARGMKPAQAYEQALAKYPNVKNTIQAAMRGREAIETGINLGAYNTIENVKSQFERINNATPGAEFTVGDKKYVIVDSNADNVTIQDEQGKTKTIPMSEYRDMANFDPKELFETGGEGFVSGLTLPYARKVAGELLEATGVSSFKGYGKSTAQGFANATSNAIKSMGELAGEAYAFAAVKPLLTEHRLPTQEEFMQSLVFLAGFKGANTVLSFLSNPQARVKLAAAFDERLNEKLTDQQKLQQVVNIVKDITTDPNLDKNIHNTQVYVESQMLATATVNDIRHKKLDRVISVKHKQDENRKGYIIDGDPEKGKTVIVKEYITTKDKNGKETTKTETNQVSIDDYIITGVSTKERAKNDLTKIYYEKNKIDINPDEKAKQNKQGVEQEAEDVINEQPQEQEQKTQPEQEINKEQEGTETSGDVEIYQKGDVVKSKEGKLLTIVDNLGNNNYAVKDENGDIVKINGTDIEGKSTETEVNKGQEQENTLSYDELLEKDPVQFFERYSAEFGEDEAVSEIEATTKAIKKENDKLRKKLETTTSIDKRADIKRKIKANEVKINKLRDVKKEKGLAAVDESVVGVQAEKQPAEVTGQKGNENKVPVQVESDIREGDNGDNELKSEVTAKQETYAKPEGFTEREYPQKTVYSAETKKIPPTKDNTLHKEGKYHVVKVDNGVEVVDNEGNIAKDNAAKRVITAYRKKGDFDTGKTLSDITDEEVIADIRSNPNYAESVARHSENPAEVLSVMSNTPKYIPLENTNPVERAIYENLGRITRDSWDRFADKNTTTMSIAKNYFTRKGEPTHTIDQVAQEASYSLYPDGNGNEITPDDVVRFIYDYPKGGFERQYTPEYTELTNKFVELTGINPTPMLIERYKHWTPEGDKSKYELSDEQINEIIDNDLKELDEKGLLPTEQDINELLNTIENEKVNERTNLTEGETVSGTVKPDNIGRDENVERATDVETEKTISDDTENKTRLRGSEPQGETPVETLQNTQGGGTEAPTSGVLQEQKAINFDDFAKKTVSDVNNEWGEKAQQHSEKIAQIDKLLEAKRKELNQYKGRLNNEQKAEKKAIQDEIDDIRKQKNELNLQFDTEQLHEYEQFRDYIGNKLKEKGIEVDDEELSEITSDILIGLYERPYMEQNWDKSVQEVIDNYLGEYYNNESYKQEDKQRDERVFAGDVLEKPKTEHEEKVKEAEKEVDTNPTEKQIEAENYKKGHLRLHGLDISIENARGSERSGTNEKGNKWSVTMKHPYGYFKRTKASDGDHIDVIVGDNPESKKVFVVDQINPDTKEFDEVKVVMGVDNIEQAKQTYLDNYASDWKGLGVITETDIDGLKKWFDNKDNITKKNKPFSDYKDHKEYPKEVVEGIKPKEKQPWEMTREEFLNAVSDRLKKSAITKTKTGKEIINRNVFNRADTKDFKSKAGIEHKQKVEKALSEGKPVPKEVLKDYPELGGEVKEPKNAYDSKLKETPKLKKEREMAGYKKGNAVMYEDIKLDEQKAYKLIGAPIKSRAKIETQDDIAFIFKNLENATTENAFMLFTNKDGKKPTILYVSSGGIEGSVIDVDVILAAAKRLGAKKAWLIHNHPSGNLKPSGADISVLKKINKALSEIGVETGEGIIIDLDKGEYTVFTETYNSQLKTPKSNSGEKLISPKVYKFNKKELYVPSNDRKPVKSIDDVAIMMSKIKRGTRDKYIVVLTDRSLKPVRHLLYDDTMPVDEIINDIIDNAAESGFKNVFIGSNTIFTNEQIKTLKERLDRMDKSLLDVLHIQQDPDIRYKSLINEEKEVYNAKNVLYSKKRYLSPTQEALTRIKQPKGKPEQMKAELLKSGAKQAELEWMGWDDFVKDKKKLTKEEIEQWINENKIEIKEVEHKQIPDNLTVKESGENYREIVLTMPEGTKNNSNEYKSRHFDEPNIVAHSRVQDFKGQSGDNVLHVEEIQSDWAQEGKRKGFEKGYKKENLSRDYASEEQRTEQDKKLFHIIKDSETGQVFQIPKSKYENIDDAIDYIVREKKIDPKSVPDMPFRKTRQWAGLVLKRMVQEAVEKGYDAITWTTGETQVERYDLSKQVNKVKYTIKPKMYNEAEQTYTIDVYDKHGNALIRENDVTKDKIADILGKEISEKISKGVGINFDNGSVKEGVLSGLDLKVGGEGMKAFYDNIIPKLAEKLFKKKYGATVEKTTLANGVEVWKMKLTPELKYAANEGFPIFMYGKRPSITDVTDIAKNTRKSLAEFQEQQKTTFDNAVNELKLNNVHFAKTIHDLPNHYLIYLRKQGVEHKVKGIFDPESKTKEIWIIGQNIDSVEGVREVILHEAVGHRGVREVLGKDYDKALQDVYRSIPQEYINDIMRRYTDKNGKPPDIYKIADEYIALNAENDVIPDAIQRFYARVRELLRKYFGVKYSVNDINYLLYRSRMALMESEQKETEGETKYKDLKDIVSDSRLSYMTDLWHGSPYDFERFDKSKIGTGEGAQAYGYGLYFTDKEGIARGYAKNGINYYDNLKINNVPVGKTKGMYWQGLRYPEYSDKKSMIESLKRDLDYMIKIQNNDLKLLNNKEITTNDDYYDALQRNINERKKEIESIEYLLDNKDKIKFPKHNLYKVKIHGDKSVDELNFLRWDKPITKEHLNKVVGILRKNANESGLARQYLKEITTPYLEDKYLRKTGEEIYNILSNALGRAKASEELLKSGIDGIQYPSEYTTKGSHEESFNYVVFDDKAIEIEDKIRFSLAGAPVDLEPVKKITKNYTAKDLYSDIEDEWIGNRQVRDFEADMKAQNYNNRIKDVWKKHRDELKKLGALQWKDLSFAMLLYADSLARPEDLDLPVENKRIQTIVNIAKNLPAEAKEISLDILKENKIIGQEAMENNVIFNMIELYMPHLWYLEGKKDISKEAISKFSKTTSHARQRTLGTIMEGLSKGMELRVEGIAESYAILAKSIYPVIENRKLIEAGLTTKDMEGNPIFKLNPKKGDDYHEIKHPNFYTYKMIKAGKKKEIEGVKKVKAQGDIIELNNGALLVKQRVYAPKEVADRLNNILSTTNYNVLDKFNRVTKALILSYSFFHHLAFTTSYLGGAAMGKLKDVNPVTAYKDGLKMMSELEPDITTLVKNGLTLGRNQDYGQFSDAQREQKNKIEKLLDKHQASKYVKDKVMGLYEAHTNFLFNKLGSGLKAKAALMEYRKLLDKYPDKDPNELAKWSARLVNADFGGLNMERIGRSKAKQKWLSRVLLSKDWSESNLLTLERLFGYDHSTGKISKEEAKLYRAFWTRIMVRGAVATTMMNLMMAYFYKDSDDDNYWEALTQMYDDMFSHPERLNWMKVDITPIYKYYRKHIEKAETDPNERRYLSIYRHFLDPIKWGIQSAKSPLIPLSHKGSVLTRLATNIITGADWQGKRYTTAAELFGTDDKGRYVYGKLNSEWKPGDPLDKKYLFLAGDPKGGKYAGKLTKWGTPTDRGMLTWEQVPSFTLSTMRSYLPIPLANLVITEMGEMESFDMFSRGFGFYINRANTTKPDKIDEEYSDISKTAKMTVTRYNELLKTQQYDKVNNYDKDVYINSKIILQLDKQIKDLEEKYDEAQRTANPKTAEYYKELIRQRKLYVIQELNKQ